MINYAEQTVPYTRTIEFRHFHPERDRDQHSKDATVVATEFSRWAAEEDEPYYPVNRPEDRTRVKQYREILSKTASPNLYVGGRLGSYQYLDMHQAIASALKLAEKIVGRDG